VECEPGVRLKLARRLNYREIAIPPSVLACARAAWRRQCRPGALPPTVPPWRLCGHARERRSRLLFKRESREWEAANPEPARRGNDVLFWAAFTITALNEDQFMREMFWNSPEKQRSS
jgi:hypothetical protein